MAEARSDGRTGKKRRRAWHEGTRRRPKDGLHVGRLRFEGKRVGALTTVGSYLQPTTAADEPAALTLQRLVSEGS